MQVSNLGMANVCRTENRGKEKKGIWSWLWCNIFSIQAIAFGTYLVSKWTWKQCNIKKITYCI